MRKRNHRLKVTPRLSAAAVAASKPLAGSSNAATLAWDRAMIIRAASGAVPSVFGLDPGALRGRALPTLFQHPESLSDALHFGMARPMLLHSGLMVQVEAGPCPGGAVAVVRRPTGDQLDLSDLASAIGHELRNAFSSVMLAVQSLSRHEEVTSERGRRRLQLAEWELRRIECALRGIQEVGKGQRLRLVEASPELLVAEALACLGPRERERLQMIIPRGEGATAHLDAPRVCLAIEEMFRLGIRSLPAGGTITASIERRAAELAFHVSMGGAPAEDAPALDDPSRPPDLGIAVIHGVARAHGGHVELAPSSQGRTLSLILPQRPGL